MSVPITSLKLEDGGFSSRVGSFRVSIHGVFSRFDFSSRVELVFNDNPMRLHEPFHPIVGRHVFVSQLGSKVVISQSAHERTHGHGLADGLEVQGIGVEPEDRTATLLVSYPGLTGAVVTGEDDALSDNKEILVLFVEKSEIRGFLPGRAK